MPLERKWRSYSHGCVGVQSSFATYSPLWYLGLQKGSFRHLASFVSVYANSDDNDTSTNPFKQSDNIGCRIYITPLVGSERKQRAGNKWKVLS